MVDFEFYWNSHSYGLTCLHLHPFSRNLCAGCGRPVSLFGDLLADLRFEFTHGGPLTLVEHSPVGRFAPSVTLLLQLDFWVLTLPTAAACESR
jgi:hypothetical protein